METPQQAVIQAVELEVAATGPVTLYNAFLPSEHGLDSNFRLTKFAELKG